MGAAPNTRKARRRRAFPLSPVTMRVVLPRNLTRLSIMFRASERASQPVRSVAGWSTHHAILLGLKINFMLIYVTFGDVYQPIETRRLACSGTGFV